ncbi:MAG: translational machinery protein [Steroidobacteraceae bacterium]|jgi:stalled ribosome rescue protein Dom34
MSHYHAVVWIDHLKASIWQVTATDQQHSVVHAHSHHGHGDEGKHTKAHHELADYRFFDETAKALAGAHEILVIGPAQTKHDFVAYLTQKHAALAKLIVAVETADHPTDKQIVAYARKHFSVLDKMLP